MIFPLDAIPWGVRWISYILPLTYYTMISVGVMLRGAGIGALALPFGVLAVMAAVVFSVSVLRFHSALAPSRRSRESPTP
jgi:ABC-2 type transport system permease protein